MTEEVEIGATSYLTSVRMMRGSRERSSAFASKLLERLKRGNNPESGLQPKLLRQRKEK